MVQRCLFAFATLALQFLVIQLAGVNNTYGQSPSQQQFAVREGNLTGLDDKQVALMRQAIGIFQIVMNDAQFRKDLAALKRVEDTAVIKRSERIKKYKVENNDVNNKLTTQQIVTNLLNGTEYFDPRGTDNRIITHLTRISLEICFQIPKTTR
ncbi:MAG: hypothetical protein M3R11_12550 [Acidobacteriota bacterium]|jgi:hypothetical protein|nr:hypothetical protein [Acidobacteriota bacterium]